MADETKNQTSVVPPAEYAGPPKSHSFKDEVHATDAVPVLPTPVSSQPASSDDPYASSPKSAHFSTDDVKIPPHAPAHIGILSEEEAEKEILDVPSKPPSLIDLIADPEDNPQEQKKKKFELNWHFDPKIFKKYKDEVRTFFEQNPMIYKTFQVVWMFMMTLIYLGGIAFFTVFFVLYFAFTPLLRGYLNSRGLSNVDFTVASHSLSELTIKDIKDTQGIFKIKSIRLQYTFTNFLKGKITLADVDSLEIFIKQDKDKGYNVRDLMTVFLKLGLMDRNSPMHIQSLQFKNSKVFVGDQAYPIDFSGIGDLEIQRQFIIPFTFQNDYLTANASLTTSIEGAGTTWTVTLDNGKLTLPKLPAEMVSGTLVWKTRNTHLQSFNADLSLKQENNEKKVSLQLLPVQGGKANVNLTMDLPREPGEAKPLQVNITLRNATIGNNLKSITTKDPLNIKLTNVNTDFLKADTIQASLNGTLACEGQKCTFKQTRPSDIIFFSPVKKVWDTEITVSYPLRVTLTPGKENLFVLDQTKLTFDSMVRKSSFNLTKIKNNETSPLSISTGETSVKGTFDLVDRTGTLQTSSENISWSDNALKFERAQVQTQSDKNGSAISLSTPTASLVDDDLLKIPFALQLQMTPDQYFNLALQSDNKQVTLNANGYFSTFTGEILAAVETQPIRFDKETLQPSKITGLFDESLRNVTGTITCRGQFHWKNDRSVDGPMNILLDKVSFDYGNVQVKNLSTMMEITSFVPFGTKRNQEAFVESIITTLPFSNIDINYYFDKSKRQFNISRMNMELADVIFRIDPTWLTYQSPVQTFLFKAKNIDLEQVVPYARLDNFNMQGNISSASFSLQLDNEKVLLKNMELTIPQDGTITYTPESYSNASLDIFKNLSFKKATVILNELENQTTDFLFIGDSTNPQDRRKTTIRFNITEPLRNFIKSADPKPIPDEVIDKMKQF